MEVLGSQQLVDRPSALAAYCGSQLFVYTFAAVWQLKGQVFRASKRCFLHLSDSGKGLLGGMGSVVTELPHGGLGSRQLDNSISVLMAL